MMAEPEVNVDEISHMTDEELKQAYTKLGVSVGPITPTTRRVLEQQLRRKINGVTEEQGTEDNGSSILNEKTQKVFSEKTSTATEAHVYFGIFVPEGLEGAVDTDFQKVYTDKTMCLAAMKKYRGSRFKAFRSHSEALQFAEAGPSVATSQSAGAGEDGATVSALNAEKPSPFRGPKSQDLVKFRKAIERDDMEFFRKCIDENPRYLVSGGDTPSVLQEGFRYNALHVACRTDRPAFVEKVLTTVGQAEFFQRLYPDDTVETASRRSAYLLDLYLNTPDKGLNETPIHFASKHGSVDCVRVLTSYPACDKLRNNKFSQKPIDIVGSRMKVSSERVSDSISRLLGDQWYVPLLRDDDNCLLPQVGHPCSSSPTSPPSFSTLSPVTNSPASPISPLLKVRGYAGPMSPTQAEAFQRLWKTTVAPSPPRHPKSRLVSLRITDHEKGLERLGRELAVDKGFEWREYWDFLGEFTNLATEEGLQKLEAHLRHKFRQIIEEKDELDASDLAERLAEEERNKAITLETPGQGDKSTTEVNVSSVSQSSRGTMDDLCQDLEALRLNMSLSPQLDAPHLTLVSASSKFLASLRAREESGHDEPDRGQKIVVEEVVAQQLSYIIKSVDVAAFRLAEVMGELACDLQSNTVANLSLPKTIRTKLKPEILCLKNVVGKCCPSEPHTELEFGFIHVLLASKAVAHMQKNLMPGDINVLAETMKMFVSHLNFMNLDSSDEEGNVHVQSEVVRDKENDAHHFTCVLQCLEKALNIAQSNSNSKRSLDLNTNYMNLMQLGECNCLWTKNSTKVAHSKNQIETPISTTKYKKAFNFLHQTLFSEQNSSANIKSPVNDDVVKKLSFEDGEEKNVILKAKLIVIDGVSVSQEVVKRGEDDNETETSKEAVEESEVDGDNDSFATAASSIEDDMLTPEEGVKVYINGEEASKIDVDVLTALAESKVDEGKYPHVIQWQHLLGSHSEAERSNWASPYNCRSISRSVQNSAPARTSHPTTPEHPRACWFPASTQHILFPSHLGHHNSPS